MTTQAPSDRELLLRIHAKLEGIERIHRELLVARPSREKQAKAAGVSRTTLWRREKRLRLEAMVNGRR